jgi:hypothetical protein
MVMTTSAKAKTAIWETHRNRTSSITVAEIADFVVRVVGILLGIVAA